jgi:hypothetical protein
MVQRYIQQEALPDIHQAWHRAVIGTVAGVVRAGPVIIAADLTAIIAVVANTIALPTVADTVLCIHTLMLAPVAALHAVIFY